LDCGLGKTVVSIAIISALLHKSGVKFGDLPMQLGRRLHRRRALAAIIALEDLYRMHVVRD